MGLTRAMIPRRAVIAIPYLRASHMEITDILASMGGLLSMARDLGVSEQEASTGAAALIPAIPGGFKKQAAEQDRDGNPLDDIMRMVGRKSP
jgi:hypothetical protein